MAPVPMIGNMTWQQNGTQPQNQVGGVPAQAGSGGFDALLGSTLQTAGSVYGSQNAAEAQNKGILAGIGTQHDTMGNINSLFGSQTATGNGAFNQLGSALGVNGKAPDPSTFYNQPGYKFAVDQGTQAIQRMATANGSIYTPNTLASVGQYVTGTAGQNYNNYIQQLLSTAGLGAQGNNTLSGANLQTGANISQLQQNSGTVQGAGVNSAAGGIGGLLGNIFGNGANGSGLLGAAGGLSGIAKTLGGLFGKGKGGGGAGSTNGTGFQNPGVPSNDFMNMDLGGNFLNMNGGGFSSGSAPSDINIGSSNLGNLSTSDLFGSSFDTSGNGNFGGFNYSNPM